MNRISRREALRITAVAGVSATLGGGLIKALLREAALHRVRETRIQLGTLVSITVLHPDAAAARWMVTDTFDEIERLENLLSRYRPTTPIAQLNRDGVIRNAPAEVLEVITTALNYSVLTRGAFDISIAPVLNLYRASFARTGAPPASTELQRARELVGYNGIRIDGSDIAFARAGMSLTLDGIAKGYVVDRAAQLLRNCGADQVLVGASGDMASLGSGEPEDAWGIAIQSPREERRFLGVLKLRGDSIATSGDYFEYFTPDKRYHHIIDPGTGDSPLRTSAVTIVAPKAVDADALATAVMVLGPEDGLALLDRLDRAEGMIVTKEQAILRSGRLRNYQA
jgi:thiamine biosynthesis lipoprotein